MMGFANVTPVCACCHLDLRGDEETPWLRGHEPEWLAKLMKARDAANERAENAEEKLKVPGETRTSGEIVERARRYQHGVSNLSTMLARASIAVSKGSGEPLAVGAQYAEVRHVLDWLNREAHDQKERADVLSGILRDLVEDGGAVN